MYLMIWIFFLLHCPVQNTEWNETNLTSLKPQINKLIKVFNGVLKAKGTRIQFGGLFLFHAETPVEFEFSPSPINKTDGMMLFHNPPKRYAPFDENDFHNFFASAPVKLNPNENETHSEDHVLQKSEELLNAYEKKHGQKPTHALLWTYLSPCTDCTHKILEFKDRNKHLKLAVAYSLVYEKPNKATNQQNLENLKKEGVFLINMVKGTDCNILIRKNLTRSIRRTTCERNTFQGCLLDNLTSIFCFQNDAEKVVFVNAFAAKCFPDYSQSCSDLHVDARLRACTSSKEQQRSSFYANVQDCSSNALSNPLSQPGVFTGILKCANCLQTPLKSNDFKQVSACGHRGILCTTTAGNSVCRDDHYCGLHGESYSWCYIDDEDNWDYCCLGSCKMDSQKDAMMCYTGQATDNATDTQESAIHRYCGDAGTQTVTGEDCDASHSCGTHNGTDYFWCYTQSGLGWDYCCRPDQVCGKKGQDFNWCLVGWNSSKSKCNPTGFDVNESSRAAAITPVLLLQTLLVCYLFNRATHVLN